jgi:hypothetical protein
LLSWRPVLPALQLLTCTAQESHLPTLGPFLITRTFRQEKPLVQTEATALLTDPESAKENISKKPYFARDNSSKDQKPSAAEAWLDWLSDCFDARASCPPEDCSMLV